MDSGDGDPLCSRIADKAAVKAGDRALGQGVKRSRRKGRIARHRRADLDDPSARLYVARGFLRGDENPDDIDGDHALIGLEGDFLDRAAKAKADIAHEDVDVAKMRLLLVPD